MFKDIRDKALKYMLTVEFLHIDQIIEVHFYKKENPNIKSNNTGNVRH